MRFFFSLFCLLCLALPSLHAQRLVSGADVSWCTEMEADGRKFYNAAGEERDIFALMKELGMTAIRLRVWVDPTTYGYGAWCDKADVVAKAKRAHAQGLDLMIDFHYSDTFADPEHQNVPKAWEGMTMDEVKQALANHTTDVLQALKDEGITPKWVQVGNETNSGLVLDYGKIDWDKTGAARFTNYVALSNAGYDAVKSVFPDAQVIVHLGGTENPRWFFPDFKAAGGKFDMIGVSHYPTEAEWNSTASDATHSNVNAEKYIREAISTFNVPVMVCETGFDVTKPALAQEVMIDLFNRLKAVSNCAGIFYWEPEVDGVWKPKYYETVGWNAYGMGAFTTDGKPTKALDAFGGKTVADNAYPDSLLIYDKDGKNVLLKLRPVAGQTGVFAGQFNVTEAWQNFFIVDPETNTWYGSDPSDKTKLSSASDHWNLWISSDKTGVYDITVDMVNLSWTHTFNESATAGIEVLPIDGAAGASSSSASSSSSSASSSSSSASSSSSGARYFDLLGRRVSAPVHGQLYIVKQGRQVSKRVF